MLMKTKKITALMLVLAFLLLLAACGNGKQQETTATEDTTVPGETTTVSSTTDTTAPTTTQPGETTTAPASTTAPGETTVPATTAPVGIDAPVGGTKAQIVAFYSQYANATKKFMGPITVRRDMGTVTQITRMDTIGLIKNILQGILDRQLQDESKTKSFNNGYAGSDKNDTLEKFLPRGADKPMSELVPAGVKSASCAVSGTGWVVKITLYKEVVSGLSTPPKHHTSVMDPMTINPQDLDPFTIGDGKVTYGDVNSADTGASLVATFNAKGYLTKLRLDAPLQIAGKLGFNNRGIDTVIDGKWWGEMTFTY